jgi:hypothetical protein
MVSGKIFIQILPSDSKKSCGKLEVRLLLAAYIYGLWSLEAKGRSKRVEAMNDLELRLK